MVHRKGKRETHLDSEMCVYACSTEENGEEQKKERACLYVRAALKRQKGWLLAFQARVQMEQQLLVPTTKPDEHRGKNQTCKH